MPDLLRSLFQAREGLKALAEMVRPASKTAAMYIGRAVDNLSSAIQQLEAEARQAQKGTDHD